MGVGEVEIGWFDEAGGVRGFTWLLLAVIVYGVEVEEG